MAAPVSTSGQPNLPKQDHRCTGCGYGVATTIPPERCPTCQQTAASWTPNGLATRNALDPA